jgi:hypothetical protein
MISSFLKELEVSVSSSSIVVSSTIQTYFSATKKEVYIKGSLTFIDLSVLEFAIYALGKNKKIMFDKYRFQYMDSRKRLIFRYDNVPHYKNVSTFPYHKHRHDGKVIESAIPQFRDILEEITAVIAQSSS